MFDTEGSTMAPRQCHRACRLCPCGTLALGQLRGIGLGHGHLGQADIVARVQHGTSGRRVGKACAGT